MAFLAAMLSLPHDIYINNQATYITAGLWFESKIS
jgi:hypothetical protein